MPKRLRFDARVSEGAVHCGAPINSPVTSVSASQPQAPSASPNASSSDDLHLRLEKAMRRAELLSYAAAGLGGAILFAIIGIAFV
jgi:hypothetical protein